MHIFHCIYSNNTIDTVFNTEVLGNAFEPEQPFENADGTPIQFDQDYFGNHRGVATVPGPYAGVEDAEKVLYVK